MPAGNGSFWKIAMPCSRRVLPPLKFPKNVMNGMVKDRGFLDYSSYIAKVGRGRFVEIHVLVSPESRIDTATADAIRSDISERLNAASPAFWLTIDFTADRRWL